MITKTDLEQHILPVLRKKYMLKEEENVYQPFDIKGYHYSDIFEMFTLNSNFLLYEELTEYYKNNGNYDWREIVDWAHKNADNLEYKFTKYPKDERIMAIKSDSATSILFSKSAMDRLSNNRKLFICPLYEDFVLFMYKDQIDDLIEFVKIIKSMNYTMFQKGKMKKYISDTVFVYDPTKKELSVINTEKEFGVKFNIVTLNADENITSQIRKEANNVLLEELKDCNAEEAYEVLCDKELYDTMIDEIESNIRRVISNGKNNK